MANVSTARKLSILARVAAQQAERTRTGLALLKGVRATAAHCAHVLRRLWLEITGFVFLAIAGIGALALVRECTRYRAGQAGPGRAIVAIFFTGIFAWFGLNSFWRSRKRG
jgi:hypothetical protein